MARENHENSDKHESVNDLHFIKELKRSASGLEWLGRLLRNDEVRKSGREVREELDNLVSLIDDFYYLLGNRNWVFSDALEPERMRAVVSKPTPEEAERELIEYLKEEEVLHRMITRLNRFPDMRPRIPLLKKAEQDYLQGRYYSSVLVTVTVMDGFVNDAFRSEGRKGLHARESEELHAGDCVATVWDGLPSIQKAFTKSIRARIDEPVCEVYRHGIMHGMVTPTTTTMWLPRKRGTCSSPLETGSMPRLGNERLKTKILLISFKCSRASRICRGATQKMTEGSRAGRSTVWISSILQIQTKSSSETVWDSSRLGRRRTTGC